MIFLPIIFPVLAGLAMLKLNITDRAKRQTYVIGVMVISLILTLSANFAFGDKSLTVAAFSSDIYVTLQTDGIAVLFSTLFAVVWLLVAIFSLEYIKHEGEDNRFFAYFIASLGALIGVAYADNLVTLYLFFEAMSLLSYVLVVHSRTNESLIAGRKYIYYSLFGASLGLVGIFYFYSTPWERAFVPGGVVPMELGGIFPMLNILVILAVVGFGCKSGLFPLHSWLPTAHPQAPAPASSVLSGLITKAGIIAIIRIVYFTVGADVLQGSMAQKVLLALSIVTIFMGSMLAYKERVLKKRLAYSTVSQVSYVIFGLMLLNTTGVTGALLQVVFHALAKNVLFLCAGAIIYKTHKTNCDDLYGLGRTMPKTFACFTIAGLSLVGVPLTAGFVSKWYLAQGALQSGAGTLGFIGLCVLMISALLTAGYLLTTSIRAFFPVAKGEKVTVNEANGLMTVPLIILTGAIVLFGVFPSPLISFVQNLAQSFVI